VSVVVGCCCDLGVVSVVICCWFTFIIVTHTTGSVFDALGVSARALQTVAGYWWSGAEWVGAGP
jgi:hypothetical protein